MNFGERLQELRYKRLATQRELAAALGMDTAYLSKIEGDKLKSLPSRDTIERIAAILKLSASESDELHILAGKVPKDVETALFENPKLMAVVRRRAA